MLDLPGAAPGASFGLTVRRFGTAGASPKVYVQAGLHADEVPGMIAAHHLTELLRRHEEAGRIRGEIVIVPIANPIGLSQRVLHRSIGRFHLEDGRNFNRGHAWLAPMVAAAVAGRLGPDEAGNRDTIRAALREAVAAQPASSAVEHLRRTLLGLAIDADIVLDLHCAGEAVQHIYTLTPHAERCAPLAGLMRSEATLLATESGDDPFDEACSRPWLALQQSHPDHPIPLACFAATLEFRGQSDVDHGLAAADARAMLDFLIVSGVVDGPTPAIPPACPATELAAAEPLVAPSAGILVFLVPVGARVQAGEAVAEIVDPLGGGTTPIVAEAPGLLFTRTQSRFVLPGDRVGKLAGTALRRSGLLLSA